jgi:hypothetical protein
MAQEPEVMVEILEDGTIKIVTSKVSAANHLKAEKLLKDVTALSGGEVSKAKRKGVGHSHTHNHNVAGH